MHAAVCFSRAVSDCEIFVSYDLFGAELNLFAPLSCSVSLGPEDKHIRACTPSHSWPGLDIHLISATSLSFLAPAVREERKWEQTSIWLRGCGWIEWKCGKQLNIGICLYFSCADEGKKWPSCFNTFHYFRFVVEHFWLHHSDWLIEIETVFRVSPSFCLLWPWQMAGHLAFCQSLGLWVNDSKDLQFEFMLAWFWNNSIDLFQLKFTLKGIVN